MIRYLVNGTFESDLDGFADTSQDGGVAVRSDEQAYGGSYSVKLTTPAVLFKRGSIFPPVPAR